MKITKGNVIKEVTEKAGKIAIRSMGWAEVTEAAKPSEIGTKTKRNEPPVILSAQPVKLKEAVYPGDEPIKIIQDESGVRLAESEPKKVIPKKTRKAPVKSKSSKK